MAALPSKREAKERRRQKKIEKAQRNRDKRSTNPKDNTMSVTVNTAGIRVTKIGNPLDPKVREALRAAIVKHGEVVVKNTIHLAEPSLSRASVIGIMLLLKDDAAAEHRFKEKLTKVLVAAAGMIADGRLGPNAEMADWVVRERTARNEIVSAGDAPQGAQAPQGINEALMSLITNAVLNAVDLKLEEKMAQFGPKPADVDERLRHWEHVKQIITSASREDGLYPKRWSVLTCTFEIENKVQLKDRARELGIDTDDEKWMRQLVVRERVEFVLALLEIAKRLFKPAAKAAGKG